MSFAFMQLFYSSSIKEDEPYGTIVLEVPMTKSNWTVNGKRLKPYFGGEVDRQMSTISLIDPRFLHGKGVELMT
jgi:hypothetical protein